MMKVKTNTLQEGCILSKDVYSKTNRPILLAKTIIDQEKKRILNAFLIKEVSVERTMIDGKKFSPKEIIDAEETDTSLRLSKFITSYLHVVQQFKRLFKGWQAGASFDIIEVRKIYIPLLEQALSDEKDIFHLHHYSTKDDYFYHHAISVGLISGYIAKKLGFEMGNIVQVSLGGCLSDVGMAKVPKGILEKDIPLSFEEYNEIKKHPIYGFKMLEKSSSLKKEVKIAVLQHHERLDGSGYPGGEKEDRIHIYSKIVAVADVYHAMISERTYRSKQSPYRVWEMIRHDDFGKFDLKVIKALATGVVQIVIGSNVKLSNGTTGEVLYINNTYPTRPTIKLKNNELLDLEKNRSIFIEQII